MCPQHASWIADSLDPVWAARSDYPRVEELAPGFLLHAGRSNNYVLETSAGLLVIDPGDRTTCDSLFDAVRAWSEKPVHTVVYTHGHVDHVCGLSRFLDEGARPAIVAQENILERFRRYRLTHGFNEHINRRQSGNPNLLFPERFDEPTQVFRDEMTLRVGELDVRFRAARGETDDSCYVWIPQRKALFVGDLATWKVPNAGNPQKVQRYPVEWADALERMADLGAEWLCPGHDLVLRGAGNIRTLLLDHAAYLRSLIGQVLERMNAGESYEEILLGVRPDPELAARPYIRQVWNHSSFVVRDLLRLWGGWWNGCAADLLPIARERWSGEIARLAGGVDVLVERGRRLLIEGDLPLAAMVCEWAVAAAPQEQRALELKRDVYARRAEAEAAGIARGAFRAARDDAARALDRLS